MICFPSYNDEAFDPLLLFSAIYCCDKCLNILLLTIAYLDPYAPPYLVVFLVD